jgi:hypothetical protein
MQWRLFAYLLKLACIFVFSLSYFSHFQMLLIIKYIKYKAEINDIFKLNNCIIQQATQIDFMFDILQELIMEQKKVHSYLTFVLVTVIRVSHLLQINRLYI